MTTKIKVLQVIPKLGFEQKLVVDLAHYLVEKGAVLL